jgi:hypothetical protein
MPYLWAPKPPVMARMEIHNSNGSIQSYDLGLWSPGYTQESTPSSVRRVKPKDLIGNLTPWGGHSRYVHSRVPQSWSTAPDAYGSFVKYIDIDPQWYATVGGIGLNPEPDWQTKLRLAVKDQKVNLAQTLAEYPQAQKMFVNNATTIVKTLRSLRRGDMNEVFKTLGIPRKQLRGTISNRWLELQYGWMPLLSDLHGSVEELQAGLTRPRTRKITVRATAEEDRKVQNYYVPHLQKYSEIDAYAKTTVKVVAYLRQESLAASRLGLTNPLNLAWELVPYSFVIDWFIPIGNWLNSLDAGIGTIGITGTVTTKTKYIATNWFGSQYYMTQGYGRSVLYDLPNAPLPSWKPSLGWKQVANALALLSQLKR